MGFIIVSLFFYRLLAKELGLDITEASLRHLFIRDGRRYNSRDVSADFSTILSNVTEKLPEKVFMLWSEWRHAANAFMKAHLRYQEVKEQLSGQSDVRDLQTNHTTKTSDLAYGTTQSHPWASETYMLLFMRASLEWHGFLGFPEGEKFLRPTVLRCLRSSIPASSKLSTQEQKLAESLSETMALANTTSDIKGIMICFKSLTTVN